MIVDEAIRSLHDALCVVRNLIKTPRIVFGGGAPELACNIAVSAAADHISTVEQYAVRGFADALEQIPNALADNSGINPIQAVAEAKAAQIKDNCPHYGINCLQQETNNMKTQFVYETYLSKRQQFQLATQVVKMILKIDDVIAPDDAE